MKKKHIAGILPWVVVFLLAGCSNSISKQAKNTAVATASTGLPGCGSSNKVYRYKGRRYQVLPSASGYQQTGMASWYGSAHQGRETASCERFDMNGFSAAHRTLPIPSIIRVTNLQNNKSVVVRVNDRGPFQGSALVQLSFAAANVLGMTESSGQQARVKVEGLHGAVGSSVATNDRNKAWIAQKQRSVSPSSGLRVPFNSNKATKKKRGSKRFYVVVRNFAKQADALDLFIRLTSVGLKKTEMATANQRGRQLHQVRIGPLYSQDQIDNVRDSLESNGLATFRVISVNQ